MRIALPTVLSSTLVTCRSTQPTPIIDVYRGVGTFQAASWRPRLPTITVKPNATRASKSTNADFQELEKLLGQEPTPDRAAAKLAKLLKVQRNEVALLRAEQGLLKFLHPAELRTAGAIPVSSNAVAARTFTTRASLLSNNFVTMKHVSLFESVRLAPSPDDSSTSDVRPIQKLMSAPIQHPETLSILGVIQISRKGLDPAGAGPDFTNEELRLLERASAIIAQMEFMLRDAARSQSAGS